MSADLLDELVSAIESAVVAATVADPTHGDDGGYRVVDELDLANYPAASLHLGVSVWVSEHTESGLGRRRDTGHSITDARLEVSCMIVVSQHEQRRSKRAMYRHDARLQEIVLGTNAAGIRHTECRWAATRYTRVAGGELLRIDQTYSVRLQSRRVGVAVAS